MDPTADPTQQALNALPNYVNPAYMTPEQAANLRATAEQLMKGSQTEAKSWSGVLGNFAQALVGSQYRNQAAQQDQATGAAREKALNWQNGSAQAGAGAASGLGSAPQASAPGTDAQGLASFYSSNGLSPAGAAGLVGGFGAESAFRPGAVGDNGSSVGLAQWQGDRRKALEAYALQHGASPRDPQVQKQFPLVEMGLAGSPSDPGFGKERAAGQALQAARTPQEATAAALMYERPGGYSPQHPENSNGYSRRLALASALMGSAAPQPAGPQVASAGAMPPIPQMVNRGGQPVTPTGAPMASAYAAPGAPGGGGDGGMPPVGPGAGHPMPLAAAGAGAPQAAPGPVMAQNVPGGAPVQGSPAYARIMSMPTMPEDIRRSILGQQNPIVTQDALGANKLTRPNLTPSGAELQPGYLTGSTSVSPSGVSAPSATRVSSGQPPQTVGGTLNANDLVEQAKPAMGNLQGVAQQGAEGQADTERMATYKLAGTAAEGKLAQLETLKALGSSIGAGGLPTQFRGLAARYGVDPDGKGAALQLYTAMAQMLLPDSMPEGMRDSIPALTAQPETRTAFTQFLENQLHYQKQIGQIARDTKTYPKAGDRDAAIGKLKAPQMEFGAPPAPAGEGAAPGAASPGGTPTVDEAGYKALTKGTKYIAAGDPSKKVRTKQ